VYGLPDGLSQRLGYKEDKRIRRKQNEDVKLGDTVRAREEETRWDGGRKALDALGEIAERLK